MKDNEPISEILRRTLASRGLLAQADAARVCAISQAVGKGEFRSVSFKNGVLKVAVTSNAQAYALRLKEEEMINSINQELRSKRITRFVYKIGQ